MQRKFHLCLVIAIALAVPAIADVESRKTGESAHDKEFWRAIATNEYAIPEGENVYDLVIELAGYLSSPDSELRDKFGYTLPAVWIYRQQLLDHDQLHSVVDLLSTNLRDGIGESGTSTVLKRSFSALNLSVLAALDNREPFLEKDEFAALLDAALNYLRDEKDVRGFIPGPGWHHSTAHTADLLKFLARSPHLRTGDQSRILEAITGKFSTTGVYTFGEDERLAHAVRSLVRREDFEIATFDAWVDRFVTEAKAIWKDEPLIVEKFTAAENMKGLLRALLVIVSADDPSESESAVRTKLTAALRGI